MLSNTRIFLRTGPPSTARRPPLAPGKRPSLLPELGRRGDWRSRRLRSGIPWAHRLCRSSLRRNRRVAVVIFGKPQVARFSRCGIGDKLSQQTAIVSPGTVIFAPSAFLTKFTPGLTIFSRAACFNVHDSFRVLRCPGADQDRDCSRAEGAPLHRFEASMVVPSC